MHILLPGLKLNFQISFLSSPCGWPTLLSLGLLMVSLGPHETVGGRGQDPTFVFGPALVIEGRGTFAKALNKSCFLW